MALPDKVQIGGAHRVLGHQFKLSMRMVDSFSLSSDTNYYAKYIKVMLQSRTSVQPKMEVTAND